MQTEMYLKHLETLKLSSENKVGFPSSLRGVLSMRGWGYSLLLAVALAAGAVAVIQGMLGVPRFIPNLRGHSLSDKRGLINHKYDCTHSSIEKGLFLLRGVFKVALELLILVFQVGGCQ